MSIILDVREIKAMFAHNWLWTDLQIRGGRSSRPWDKGGGRSPKNVFRPFGPYFGRKIKEGRALYLPTMVRTCIHYTLLVFNLTLYCTFLQALALLERIIWADPTTNLQEGLLFNLCTIYELESSYSLQKKQKLLEFVSKHRGDGFNISCLKIPWCFRYLLAEIFKNRTRIWLKEKEIKVGWVWSSGWT